MTEKREVCFLIGARDVVLWADGSGSASALPDSRTRWQEIWDRRDELVEIAHSHPNGPSAFSAEDETTMEALTTALGRAIRFSVVAPVGTIVREGETTSELETEPWWASLMRLASGMTCASRATSTNKEA